MFSINDKYLNSEADVCLNKATMGKQIHPVQPTVYLIVTLKQTASVDELRQNLLNALESFTILKFEFDQFENAEIRLVVELGTSHQPNTILSIIELIYKKNKKNCEQPETSAFSQKNDGI